jgi:hypothetical protein
MSTTRYYEAAYRDQDGSIRTFDKGSPDLKTAAGLVEVLNSPNPRKPHPERVYFLVFQDRPDWEPLPVGTSGSDQ